MTTADPIIRTKLRPPLPRAGWVARPRLHALLADGLRGPLTLVTAPAGFGKTTFLVSALPAAGTPASGSAAAGVPAASGSPAAATPVAWLSLDRDDNRPGRFLGYLLAALQTAGAALSPETLALHSSAQTAPPQILLAAVVNDLELAGRELVLALDDYQFITNQAVHDALVFLLDHCPRSLHLVIASRSDPPLPLARLRGRGQVTEIRAADLRFSPGEAAQFLNAGMGLALDAAQAALLAERTEGWAAGLQMAAISLKDRPDVDAFLRSFSGTHRFILDYLLEEVLAGQPAAIQRFLLHTSILDRLSAPLCDALLLPWDAPGELPDSAAALAYLERANLFLLALDDERRWFRYHHLFADLLRARLDQLDPQVKPALHARASAWLENAGMTVEAVNHALAAGQPQRAARLVEHNTTRLLQEGRLSALMGWVAALPDEVRRARPWLCVHQAYALAFAGRLAEVAPLLDDALQSLPQVDAVPPADAAADVLPSANAENAAADAAPQAEAKPPADEASPVKGAPQTQAAPPAYAIANASANASANAAPSAPGEERALRGAVAAVRAMTAVMSGQDEPGIAWARQAAELLPPAALWDRATAAWALGIALRSLGRLDEAQAAFAEQARLGRALGNIWTLVTGLTDLGMLLRAAGRLRQARAAFEQALDEAARQGARSLGYIARMEAGLASTLYEHNELDAAHRLLSDAIQHTRHWPNPNHLAYAYSLLARVQLALGQLDKARQSILQADRVRRSEPLVSLTRGMVELELVRTWLGLRSRGALERSDRGALSPVEDELSTQTAALLAGWQAAWQADQAPGAEARPINEFLPACVLMLARAALADHQPQQAAELLNWALQAARAGGFAGVILPALILQALTHQSASAGDSPDAFAALQAAVELAAPEGAVRAFLDEGRPMQAMLQHSLPRFPAGPQRAFVARLLPLFEDAIQAEAAALAHAAPAPTAPPAGPVEALSPRELEVLQLIAQGRTNQQIAARLVVSPGTVKAHTAAIYRKLDVANRTEAAARARQLGIIE